MRRIKWKLMGLSQLGRSKLFKNLEFVFDLFRLLSRIGLYIFKIFFFPIKFLFMFIVNLIKIISFFFSFTTYYNLFLRVQELKLRVVKVYPFLNTQQNNYVNGEFYWKELFKNFLNRFLIPIRVRFEYFLLPLFLFISFLTNWVKLYKSWLLYEWHVYWFQWDFVKKNKKFLKIYLKCIFFLGISLIVLGSLCFFGGWFQLILNKFVLFFLPRGLQEVLNGYFLFFFPLFLFIFFWVYWVFLKIWSWQTSSEDLNQKFRDFDLFDEFRSDDFYKKSSSLSTKIEGKNDIFILDGGFTHSDWEREFFKEDSSVTGNTGVLLEKLYREKEGQLKFLQAGSLDISVVNQNQEDDIENLCKNYNYKLVFELLERSSQEKMFSVITEKEGSSFIKENEPIRESSWDFFFEASFQINEEDEEDLEHFLWEPEMDFFGRETDLEEIEYSIDSYREMEDSYLEWFFLFGPSLEEDSSFVDEESYFYRQALLTLSQTESDLVQASRFSFIGSKWEVWDFYDEELLQIDQAKWSATYKGKKLLQIEKEGLGGNHVIPWSHFVSGMESWFDDPMENVWIERYYEEELFEEQEILEHEDDLLESTIHLDPPKEEASVDEALALFDYFIASIAVLSYLWWTQVSYVGTGPIPRFQGETGGYRGKVPYTSDPYYYWLKSYRQNYIDRNLYELDRKYHLDLLIFLKVLKKKILVKLGKVESNVDELGRQVGRKGFQLVSLLLETKVPDLESEEDVKRKKRRRKVVFTKRYVRKYLRKNQGVEASNEELDYSLISPSDPNGFYYLEGTGRENFLEEMGYGHILEIDFFKRSYGTELTQVRDGVWTLVDFSYTWLGSFLRMVRFFSLGIVGLFWLFLEWTTWGCVYFLDWYINFWCMLCSVILVQIFYPIFLWFKELFLIFQMFEQTCSLFLVEWYRGGWLEWHLFLENYLKDWTINKGLSSLTFLEHIHWVENYYYPLNWWDKIHLGWDISGEWPRNNLVLFRVWLENQHSSFIISILVKWLGFFLEMVQIGFRFVVDLLGIVFNWNLYVLGTLLMNWMNFGIFFVNFFMKLIGFIFFLLLKGIALFFYILASIIIWVG